MNSEIYRLSQKPRVREINAHMSKRIKRADLYTSFPPTIIEKRIINVIKM